MKEYTDTELAELAAYVAGKLPEPDKRSVENDDDRMRDAERLRPFYALVHDAQGAETAAGTALADRLLGQIERDGQAGTSTHVPPRPPAERVGTQWFSRPGIWIGGAMASALVAFMMLNPPFSVTSGKSAIHLVTTAPGQRARLQLRDGSIVHLSVASTLKYAADFGANDRTVELEGEAYFEVAQVAGAPFVIRTEGTEAQVLGTTFRVRYYDDDPVLTVAVTDGKVAVRHVALSQPQVLTAGQILTASGNTVHTRMQTVAAPSWITGSVEFRQTPILDVLPEIERWYGVRVLLADSSLQTHRITTAIGEQPLDEVLRTLSVLLNAETNRVGNTVTFYLRKTI